jgi:hypothetical protein
VNFQVEAAHDFPVRRDTLDLESNNLFLDRQDFGFRRSSRRPRFLLVMTHASTQTDCLSYWRLRRMVTIPTSAAPKHMPVPIN